jgi:dUTP pyrophosphatase
MAAQLTVTRLTPNAILPARGTPGAAGYDLYSTDGYVVLPGHRVVVSTGISIRVPDGTYGRIAPRSGLAVKHGLDTLAGVIDPDYTGEVKVVLVNTDMRVPFVIKPGYSSFWRSTSRPMCLRRSSRSMQLSVLQVALVRPVWLEKFFT